MKESTEQAHPEKGRSALAGRVGLVTGGGSGIGLACAQRLAADGAAVTICGRSEQRLQDAMENLPTGANYRVCDITDENDIRQAVDFAMAERGRLDIAVVNAGYGIAGSVLTPSSTPGRECWPRGPLVASRPDRRCSHPGIGEDRQRGRSVVAGLTVVPALEDPANRWRRGSRCRSR